MRWNLVYYAICFCSLRSLSQIPTAGFNSPGSACLYQRIEFENTSSNAISFNWDFCSNDTETLTSNSEVAIIAGLSGGFGYRIVIDNGNWFGFAVSQGNHSIYRLDFGDSPLNVPAIVPLGNPDGELIFPHGIDLYKSNGNWYGFVGLNDNNSGLVRLDFGNSLTNSPTAQNLGMFGLNGRFWDVKVIEQSGDLILVIANRNTSSIVRVNYRNSFDNIIINASHVFDSGPIAGVNLATGIDVERVGADWIALIASNINNSIVQVRFASDILMPPVAEGLYSINLNRPLRIRILREGARFIAVVANENTTISTINYQDLNPANIPVEIVHSGLPSLYAADVLRHNGKSLIHGVSGFDNKLRTLIFEETCGASTNFSSAENPANIHYNTTGLKNIELQAFGIHDESSSFASQSDISNNTAPDISISNNGVVCNETLISFTSQNISGDITDYNWDFGDMNSSMDPNPTHQYTSAGEYEVSLQVTATNGCNNLARDTITIFNQPTANFDLPNTGSAPFCTNQEYLFTNTSTFDDGSNPSWQWQVNGMPISSDQDLTFTIPSAIPQDIKLIASIPGCSDELIQTIGAIEEGPLTDFTAANECEGIAVHFTNTTTGTVTGYTWNFGDGNASTQTSPSNIFEDFGNYDVTLEATNAAGCVNSIIKPITIYSKPQPDFSLDLPPFSCSGSPSQFNDLTPNPSDSNLDSWTWSFGDPINGSSAARNPQYIYADAGSYNVNLAVTTNFGCYAAIEKPVTILQSPAAEFSTSAACINQPTVFTPSSTTGAVSWQWEIDGVGYSEQNPTHTFNASLSFPAELVVTGDNGCIAIESKLVNVPVAPVIDFASMNNCATQVTTFNDASSIVTDLPQSWLWEFDESGTGSGENTSYTFPTSGTYPARLTVTYNSGCSYSIVKDVSISNPPVATFSATPEFGTPPLAVLLTNNSVSVSSQAWTIGGSVISTNPSTQFIFNELGEYSVDLSVTNASGCSDTATKMISVVVPSIDVELTSITLLPADNGYYNILLVLLNKSNTTINDIETKIDIAGNAQITETITENIPPGAMFSKVLTTGFLLPNNSSAYVCVELIATGDVDESNNRNCETTNETVVLTASPNPASDQLTLDWVASTSGNAEVYIFDSAGHRVFQNDFTNYSAGLNHLTISLTNLNPGMFYLYFMSDNMSRSFPIMINR